jgi:hypothetical protein
LPCARSTARAGVHGARDRPRASTPSRGSRFGPIDSFEDHLVGIEIDLASSTFTEEGAARRRRKRWSHTRVGVCARRHGLPTSTGDPWRGPARSPAHAASTLSGGATLPEARGRGCYRALIRARWDHAVALGTPALAVGAQETSRPILERCSFERVCTMYELETDE